MILNNLHRNELDRGALIAFGRAMDPTKHPAMRLRSPPAVLCCSIHMITTRKPLRRTPAVLCCSI